MRKQYTYDHAYYNGDAVLVLGRTSKDEHQIGMTRNATYFFDSAPGERYEVFKANQVGNMDAWLSGGSVDNLQDA